MWQMATKFPMTTSFFYRNFPQIIMGLAVLLFSISGIAIAQDNPVDSNGSLEEARPDVLLTLPDEIELGTLVDLVSEQLEINFLIGTELRGKRITLKTPAQIPSSSLYGLLESALRIRGLLIIDAKQAGWKQIVTDRELLQVGELRDQQQVMEPVEPGAIITQVFQMEHASPQSVQVFIQPFLSSQGANISIIPAHDLLIVTEFAENFPRVQKLIALGDRPTSPIAIEFYSIEHMRAREAVSELNNLMQAKDRARTATGATTNAPESVLEIIAKDRGNRVVLVGAEPGIAYAKKLLESLDVPLGLTTQTYTIKSISPARIDRLARGLVAKEDLDQNYRSVIDEESGLLIVTTTPEYHAEVASIQKNLDIPLIEAQNPVKFYKLENTKAADVLAVIRSLEAGGNLSTLRLDGEPADTGVISNVNVTNDFDTSDNLFTQDTETVNTTGNDLSTNTASLSGESQNRARVTADANTNSIIVVGEPRIQAVYESLIKRLDQRRPQVLVEVTLVTIDTSDGFSFGVELSRNVDTGDRNLLMFSQFGLSEADDDGILSLNPGLGFNGAVINANIAEVIIRALKTNTRSKVVSAPKILVNDNETGTLSSISESPVSSINASNTVSTTSFAGFVEAGTSISVTPRISEGGYMLLSYDFSLNAFTGDASDTLPPPRQTNSISSDVTIPDGHTVIVGGLTSQAESNTRSSIPLLGDIPILGEAFGTRNTGATQTTLFVFIRPIILGDDAFQGLRYLSKQDLRNAQLPSNYPQSMPILMR